MKHNKIRFVIAIAIIFFVTYATALAAGGGAGQTLYANDLQIADNLLYNNNISVNAGSGREESFSLTLTPGGDAYPVVMSCDTIYGGMTISDVVGYAQTQGYSVLAAVNSDFFSTYRVPLGIVIEQGIYKSSPENHTALLFNDDGGAAVVGRAQVDINLSNAENGASVDLTHFNKMRADGKGLYLFSSAFSTVSTRTSSDGWMVRFAVLAGEMTTAGTMTLQVTELIEGAEEAPIGEDNLILTADTTSGLDDVFQQFSPGDIVTLTTTCSDSRLAEAAWATGAGDILAADGELTDSTQWDSLITGVNPRTALGVKEDGTVLGYVVDGRNSAYSNGLTMKELANELLAQGCAWVVNLDGGGSSAMSVRRPGNASCSTVNSPSDGAERRCATYILFVTDAASDGTARQLYLGQDGAFVLAGSTISLSYLATDSAYLPVGAPGDISAVSSGEGSVKGNAYTAGGDSGLDTLTMKSKTSGARGTGTLHIVDSVDGLAVKDSASGETVSALRVKSGQSVQLAAAATYLRRDVLASADAFSYGVSGAIGTISETGLFTAGDTPGETGAITVAAGGLTYELPVTVPVEFRDIGGHWAETYINSLLDQGIVGGTSNSTYSPELKIRRGDFLLMLYRSAGQPATTGASSFSDVDSAKYYAAAIAWAEQQGIAKGSGDGAFMPESTLTREQAFTFIYRALATLGVTYVEPSSDEALAAFADSALISDYALAPTVLLVHLGIINGSNGALDPAGSLTRAQMAKILYLVLELK